MSLIHICFDLDGNSISNTDIDNFENLYQNTYKKLISFLYNHPKCYFTFTFSGVFLEWLSKKHKEFISALSELTNRKQVEVLGSGFYNPIFPLILPIDRVGQMELMTTLIRKTAGKKPRGIQLANSVWEPTLVSCLKTCGFEYVILDSSIFPPLTSKINFNPQIIEDGGKTIVVIPSRHDLVPESNISPELYHNKLLAMAQLEEDTIVSVNLKIKQLTELVDNGWLDEFLGLTINGKVINFSTPTLFLKKIQNYERTYIPAGCSSVITQWATKPYINSTDGILTSSVRQFLYTYPEIQYIYARMMYVSLLITQFRGDKMRKKTARDILWQAQNSETYWFLGENGIANSDIRQNTYRLLIQAEKTVRDLSLGTEETVLSFDYDMDGLREYLFHLPDYNAFISLIGGSIFELDVLFNARNYANTCKRVACFDGVNDTYHRRIFIDHLLEDEKFEAFTNDVSNASAVFSSVQYQEQSFDRTRKEIQLKANALFGVLQQPVLLRKKYSLTKNGIQVQYILKNESPFVIKGKFAVEVNLSFQGNSQEEQMIEIITNDSREQACPNQVFIRQDNVSVLQLTDLTSNNTFTFETNENSGICIQPLSLIRPINGKTEPKYEATTCVFFWSVNMPPSYELEKTIFLTIKPAKKVSSMKRKKIQNSQNSTTNENSSTD